MACTLPANQRGFLAAASNYRAAPAKRKPIDLSKCCANNYCGQSSASWKRHCLQKVAACAVHFRRLYQCNCGSNVNWMLRINACIAICCLCFFVPGCSGKGTLSSEVGALAHRAMPARMEYHVIQSRGYNHALWSQRLLCRCAGLQFARVGIRVEAGQKKHERSYAMREI
jgi:hypothetical protein